MPILDQMLLEQNTEVGDAVCLEFCLFVALKAGNNCETDAHMSSEVVQLTCFNLGSHIYKSSFFYQGTRWTPSKMIHRLGKEINNTDSVYYWAYKVSPCLQYVYYTA